MPKRVLASRKQTWSWQLKIELLGVSPSVWRRIVVPETIKLPKLHTVFQTALGWTNSHLHEFVIGGVRYADPDPDFADELEHVDQKNVVLVKALGIDSRCFDYVYDFGDDWHHIVIVEGADPRSRRRAVSYSLQWRSELLPTGGCWKHPRLCRVPRSDCRSRTRGTRTVSALGRRPF